MTAGLILPAAIFPGQSGPVNAWREGIQREKKVRLPEEFHNVNIWQEQGKSISCISLVTKSDT